MFVFFFLLLFVCCYSTPRIDQLRPDEIAIIQFDSRLPLRDYWQTSAKWNKYFCDKHGHKFIYFVTKFQSIADQEYCEYETLASPWCKVKAMVQANKDYQDIKLFIYMDSDAVIDKKFENRSLISIFQEMQDKLNWDLEYKPIVFNQDGPCWWCKLIKEVGYTMCLNAGTVVWYRHHKSTKVLIDWWESSQDSYEGNPIRRKFRLKWPWEQDRQMAIYHRDPSFIQIASQPSQSMMDLKAGIAPGGWCLSHLPGSGCFISHFCSSKRSKQKMMAIYRSQSISENENGYEAGQIKVDILRDKV